MAMNTAGGVRLLEEQFWDESLELVAAELQVPLDLIRSSAEGLAEHLRASAGDPEELAAAETLAQSAVKMHRIVQALIEVSRGEQT
jgi:signal transduction histidine kinase